MDAVARMLRTILGGVDVIPRFERVSDTIPILREETAEQPLPESPARLRQLFFDKRVFGVCTRDGGVSMTHADTRRQNGNAPPVLSPS